MRLAAVVPAAPALLPELTGGPVAELEDVVAAVRVALARVRAALENSAAQGCRLVVVAPGHRTARLAPEAVTGLDGYGRVVSAAGVGRDGRPVSGVAATGAALALRLLHDAGVDLDAARTVVHEVDVHAPTAACLALGAALRAEAGHDAVWLVLGDGSARRSPAAPGAWDPDSEPFDESVARMLAKADLADLAGVAGPAGVAGVADLHVARADRLMAAGRAPWQVLAGALRAEDLAGDAVTGELLLHAAPLGVAYFVAVLTRPGAGLTGAGHG